MHESFTIVHLQGAGKNDHGDNVTGLGGWGSHNCSRTDGPLGPPCELPRPNHHLINCYTSCGCMFNSNILYTSSTIKLDIIILILYIY